jgi:hypothetical protein
MVELRGLDANRRTYSSELRDFSYALHAISPKAYNLARLILPLPSVNTSVRHAQQETSFIKSAIGGVLGSDVASYLQYWRQQQNIEQNHPFHCTLAFDATGVTSTGLTRKFSPCGYCFAFMMLPLDHAYPDLLIRSMSHRHGKIDKDIREMRDKLLAILKENSFVCHFVATDGDNGMNAIHQAHFERYVNLGAEMNTILLHLTHDGKDPLLEWPVSDLLHLMKNARSRLALGSLAFNGQTPTIITGASVTYSLKSQENRQQSGSVFQARRPLDLLKDDLALQALSLENLLKLWSVGDVAGAYFLLPFVSLSLSVRVPALSMNTRLALIQVAFAIFFRMITNYPQTGYARNITERTEPRCPRKTFWTRNMCVRACNTCLALFWSIREWNENRHFSLALGRIGSHPLECHFGMTRSVLTGDPRWTRFFSSQVAAVIVQRVMGRLKMQPYICDVSRCLLVAPSIQTISNRLQCRFNSSTRQLKGSHL